jgi:hypothetical protein
VLRTQEIPAVPYTYYHFVKSESGLVNGSDKNLLTISLNNLGFDAGAKCVYRGIIHNEL